MQIANFANYIATHLSEAAALVQLPRGVEVRFKYQERDYRWVFSLIQALPDTNIEQGKQGEQNDQKS